MTAQTVSEPGEPSAFFGTRWDPERVAGLTAGVAGEGEPITARVPRG